MSTSSPRRAGGRTLIEVDPAKLVWILSARESSDREAQVGHQLKDLRAFVAGIGGTVLREVPENKVSSFKRKRVLLDDGTYGYRVVRPRWEEILTDLRKGTANALASPDIDRAMRDPRMLEDLIDVVEMYGVYVKSITGNIDLTTDNGISAARTLVNQRNQESRNTSRRVMIGQRHAAEEGGNHGGPLRSFGWRKDRVTLNKREAAHVRREIPRIVAGVSSLTLAREWNKRGIPTVTGKPWRSGTIRNMFLRPRMAGMVVYQGEALHGPDGKPVRGKWEPIMTDAQYESVKAAWNRDSDAPVSRLGAVGRGYRTNYLLSPFVRCGRCNARMVGESRRDPKTGETVRNYRCPAKGQGGCGGMLRRAAKVDDYVTAAVLKEHRKISLREVEELPPWPGESELTRLQARMDESTRQYEAGNNPADLHFPSLARMEAARAKLRREQARYNRARDTRRVGIANLAEEWEKSDFTMEQKQAAIAESVTAVIILPAGKGGRFNPDQVRIVWRGVEISST